MDRVSSSNSPRVQYSPEPRTPEKSEAAIREEKAASYANLSPDQQRVERSQSRVPGRILGNNIDVYA